MIESEIIGDCMETVRTLGVGVRVIAGPATPAYRAHGVRFFRAAKAQVGTPSNTTVATYT